MSYRKIEVAGKDYEYVIGASNIHIKGIGDFSVKKHGNPVHNCGANKPHEWVATPATVRAIILGLKTPVPLNRNGEIRMMISPYAFEIYGKTEYLCYNEGQFYNLLENI